MLKRTFTLIAASALLISAAAPAYADYTREDFVRTGTDVSVEMLSADFWIDAMNLTDEVIMTPEEIAEWNAKKENRDWGIEFNTFCSEDFSGVLSAEQLKKILDEMKAPKGSYYNEDGDKYTTAYWAELEALKNYEAVEEENPVRYGIAVDRADLRILPTDDFATSTKGSLLLDEMQNSSVTLGTPVVIVHESTDGEWYYVFSVGCGGWVRAEKLALCTDKAQWDSIRNVENFILISEDRVVPEFSREEPAANNLILCFGTKLEVIPWSQIHLSSSRRAPYDCYAAKLPVRGEDGFLEYKTIYIPSVKAHFGYFPYTAKNLIELAFKQDGDTYGWGGSLRSRDCSQFIMELYACFGFRLDRNSEAIAQSPGIITDVKGKTVPVKQEALSKAAPGSIIWFSGHVMLYLGEVDGKYYVISYTGTIQNSSKKDEKAYSCFVCSMDIKRYVGKTWLTSFERIITIANE